MAPRTHERIEASRQAQRKAWWQQPAGRLPAWAWAGVTLAVVFFILGFGAWWTYGRGGHIPAVSGFANGQKVTFIHTEASDAKVAQRLSGMVGSPVLVVPALAKVPPSLLGNVYVFTNGVKGPGPMGFQADVFDSTPTDPAYTPLRSLNLVRWKPRAAASELTSVAQIQAAAKRGALQITRPGVVVNMPLLTWPGGSR